MAPSALPGMRSWHGRRVVSRRMLRTEEMTDFCSEYQVLPPSQCPRSASHSWVDTPFLLLSPIMGIYEDFLKVWKYFFF